jgi:hypothetical protein
VKFAAAKKKSILKTNKEHYDWINQCNPDHRSAPDPNYPNHFNSLSAPKTLIRNGIN